MRGVYKKPNLKSYIKRKIKMLRSEFRLCIFPEEEAHFYELKSDWEVDQYAHDLLVKKLE